MTNHERVAAILERHRYARQWTDLAVAHDLLVELGIDPSAEAEEPEPAVETTLAAPAVDAGVPEDSAA